MSLAGWLVYAMGRLLQLIGMWLLLASILTAGEMGPSPRMFGVGIAAFLAGWGLVKLIVRRSA